MCQIMMRHFLCVVRIRSISGLAYRGAEQLLYGTHFDELTEDEWDLHRTY